MKTFKLVLLATLAVLFATSVQADDAATSVSLSIVNHKFDPDTIHVPAGKPVVIQVENKDSMAEEFDSSDLQVEKVIPGARHGVVKLQALDKGSYNFIGEYHADTAKGVIIAE
ncbi:MAG TPA: cupredoxin domain-containing protein [Alphaproteobacteria bacterium]|nr:cupredoxin domain-containing protein [Alphaproteobacteria bacterium]